MKPVQFLGNSLKCLREFPGDAWQDVYVLHAFQKKTQTTSKSDIELAKSRFAQLLSLETAVGGARVGRHGVRWQGATTTQATAC